MEAILRPLDRVRLRLFRALGPWALPLAADRDARVTLTALGGILVALLATLAAPLYVLALGPIFLGVPHLVADVRYLVLKPRFHREWRLVLFAGIPLAVAACGGGLRAAALAMAGATFAKAPRARLAGRGAALAIAAVLYGVASHFSQWADVVFAHLHNAVAVVLWWSFWPPVRARGRALALSLLVAVAFFFASGASVPFVATWRSPASDFAAGDLAATLAPGLPIELALRFALLFAFGQSVHYVIWLRVVPDEARTQRTPRPFAASWRALRADFGPWLGAGAALLAIAVLAWACVDVVAARAGYLRLAVFHGYLELVALALLLARGRAVLAP